ncbi:MAG TPA: hypothetical protein VE650_06330, partial [Acetobacteraceae bacterium]|nr:hypothetical protein [Acetobacteraceae bacterium]
LGLFLAQPSFAQAPDATLELSGGAVALGVGYTWGNGTLIFHGRRYPVRVSGLSLASVGADGYTAAGTVSNLKRLQDINGVYTSVAAGGAVGGGAGVTAMQNQNGVVIQMTSTDEGLDLTLAAEGLRLALAN